MLYRKMTSAPDHAPFVREIRKAMPFIADTPAMGMAVDLVSYTERSKYREMFEGFRLPHETVWLEHPTDKTFTEIVDQISGGRSGSMVSRSPSIGYLLISAPEGDIHAYPFITDEDGDVMAPFAGVRFFPGTGETQGFGQMDLYRENMFRIIGSGVGEEVAKRYMQAHTTFMIDVSIAGAVLASRLFALMEARDSPMDLVEAGAMSRQERRRQARKGASDPTSHEVTRIILNEEGRNHMRAVAEASEAGTARKAHWVRGHLMRTETKGYVWRKSHVRGLGDPVMRPRAVSVARESPDESPSL